MLELSQIYIYPIKSCGSVSLKSASVEPKGLQFDRRWLLVDEKNCFITQRKYPKLALFQLEQQENGFLIKYKDEKSFLPYINESKDRVKVTIWEDEVEAISVPAKARLVTGSSTAVSKDLDDWFSDILEQKVRLMRMDDQSKRLVDQKYAQNAEVSFADGYPILIIGESSLKDLNNRLENQVPIDRFRPNLVFSGGQPYEEDDLKEFAIGNSRFLGVKLCGRCMMTTIDQKTAVIGTEPMKTLAKYRKIGNKIVFGMNLIVLSGGEIKIGDKILKPNSEI